MITGFWVIVPALIFCSWSFFNSLTWAPDLAALVSERGDADDLVPLELLAGAFVPPDADEGATAVALAGVLTFKQSRTIMINIIDCTQTL